MLPMSHVSTALEPEALEYYERRAKDLQAKWGLAEFQAQKKAYAEMLHRFLPEGHPVLFYYSLDD